MGERMTNKDESKDDVKSLERQVSYKYSSETFDLAGRPKLHPSFRVSDAPTTTPDGYVLIPPKLPARAVPLSKEEQQEARRVEAATAVQKAIDKFTVSEIVGMAAGLPGRVRNLYHRVDKLLKNDKPIMDALDVVQGVISKYLAHRAEVGIHGVLCMRKEMGKFVGKGFDDVKSAYDRGERVANVPNGAELNALLDAFEKMAKAIKEADALMMLRAEYFAVGLTVHLCKTICGFDYPPHPSMEGLYSLIDLGNEYSPSRTQRIAAATSTLLSMGVELP
jgi:hypothetical protein